MPEQNRTRRVTAKPVKHGLAKLGDAVKQNPAVLLSLAAVMGVSGDKVADFASTDLPGWMIGLGVLLWAAIAWLRDHLNMQARMADAVDEMADDVADLKEDLQKGAARFAEHSERIDNHEERLGLVEAWKAAYGSD